MELYISNFSIRVSDNTDKDLFADQGETLFEIMSDNGLFKYNPTVIIADPFLFVNKGELFLFYEKQIRWYGKGYICMRKTRNLKDWTEEKIVLKEPFHLSFPYVFKENGHYYMIPETGHDGSVRLYESEDETLESWSLLIKILDDGCDWVDSSVVRIGGHYYLFTSKIEEGESYKQCLFYSDCLEGPYQEHPKSPIYQGDDFGRNAGSLFMYNGYWMRPTQDCVKGYGENVSLFRIDKISDTEYSETAFKNNILQREGKYSEGGHQFNFTTFNDRLIVATDYKKKNYNLFELARRICKRIR